MKKFHALLVLTLLCCQHLSAQKNKGSFTFSFGPAFPVGKFASKDVFSPDAGIAKTGSQLAFSYNRLLGKRFGFAVSLQGQRNPIDTKAFEKAFSTSTKMMMGQFWFASFTPPGQLPAQSLNPPFPNWKFEKSYWLSASLLAGGYGEFPLKNIRGFAFTARAMAGVIYASSPQLTGNSVTDTSMANATQTRKSGLGVTASLTGGIKYDLNKKLSLLADAAYITTTKITFPDIKSVMNSKIGVPGFPNQQLWQTMVIQNGQQQISSVNLSLGIALRL